MKTGILILAAVSLIATVVYAEPYEEEVKFGDEKWTSLNVDFEDVNAYVHLSGIYTGQVKKGKVRFVNDLNFSTEYDNFVVTDIEGKSNEMPLEDRVVGMFQFVDIYPETDTCQFELTFEASKEVNARISHGVLNVKDLAPVGGSVKNTGSVVSTDDADDPGYVKYMDQSEIGWTVSYDKGTGMITVKGSSEAYIDFDSGCYDIGVVIVK